ncbi:hypothetical protein BDF14DRAFT_502135 [Spinellus fusiger]|nr:hypothetical protein BDF14DRAFT_502135 [Spinellus fusiger]
MCRPGKHQEAVYNDHIRQHGLKYQAIVCPDGITSMLDSSAILNKIMEQLNCCKTGGKMYDLYDDHAYIELEAIIRPCVATRIAKEQQLNTLWSLLLLLLKQKDYCVKSIPKSYLLCVIFVLIVTLS